MTVQRKPSHRMRGLDVFRASLGDDGRGVRVHSAAGTEQSIQFRAGLTRLLGELHKARVPFTVYLTSRKAVSASPSQRGRLLVASHNLPADADAARKVVMLAAAKWGRPEGAKGSGNGHKQIDIVTGSDAQARVKFSAVVRKLLIERHV